jgi:hypothetical protein
MGDYITCPNCGKHHDTTAYPNPYVFGERKEDEATIKLREGLRESINVFCEKSATIIGGAISAEFAKKDETITALRARIEELTIPDEICVTAIIALHLMAEDYSPKDVPQRALDWLTAYKEAK